MSTLTERFPTTSVEDVYTPTMMQYDGSTGYYLDSTPQFSGNKYTLTARFRHGTFTGNTDRRMSQLVNSSSGYGVTIFAWSSDYSDTDRANRISVIVTNSAGTIVMDFSTPASSYLDGSRHALLVEYDGDAGTGSFIIDGVDARDQTNTNDTLTTGTLATLDRFSVGAKQNGANYWDGDIGFVGMDDSDGHTYSDFFDSNNNPIKQDETAWANSGWGSQPLFWNEFGFMEDNKGSAGDMTKTGTIDINAAEVTPTGFINYPFQIKDVYTPTMMQFDGSTAYYYSTYTSAGNKVTAVFRVKRSAFTGGGAERIVVANGGTTTDTRLRITIFASDHATSTRQNKMDAIVFNNTGTSICRLWSSIDISDGNYHTVAFDFDGDVGTATLTIDGSDADDTGNAERVAPTTGTLDSGASSTMTVGSLSNGTGDFFGGELGFLGMADSAGLTHSDFMDSNGNPINQDETTWSNSGWGAQPLFWNEFGKMDENKGSAGDMTANGTITLGDEEVVRTGFNTPNVHSYAITNPGAESGDMTGWTAETGTGFEARLTGETGVNSRTGSYLFWAGSQLEAGSYQDLIATAGWVSTNDIDSGKLLLKLTYYAGSFSNDDRVRMYMTFLDSSDSEITTDNYLGVLYPGPALDWEKREAWAIAPPRTRKIRIHMHGYRYDGTGNNAHIEDIELEGRLLV